MKFKEPYLSHTLKSHAISSKDKNELSKTPGKYVVMQGIEKPSETNLLSRLREMEEHNAHLENLVEQQTKELTEVTAASTKFLSIIAHDLRSPFSSILGVLEIIKESLKDNNNIEIEKNINIATNSANKTLILLDNLLAWTFSQNDVRRFNPVKININELLKEEIDNLSLSATQKQIIMNYSITSNLNVSADLQMVKTVLRNLISNAIKYTNTGGEISISAAESKQFVEISIKDNGIGISSGNQKNLFKIDSYNSTNGTNNERGTGFGLILCKEFIEMHGGSIKVVSEEGKGCEFRFTLPHYI